MINRVYIFDTTLRDGEQSPGVSLNMSQKIEIGKALVELGVDVIEAGFPISSPGDFEGVKTLARELKGVEIAALARANRKDIEVAWEALKEAENPRIHTFIATSDIHLQYKLRKSREEVLELAEEAVKFACEFTSNVEFSAEDATRSDWEYLAEVVIRVARAGAKVINIPDTVGYTVPQEYYELIAFLIEKLKAAGFEESLETGELQLSVHCHNDLGLAVANSLSAVLAGARQVECTVNGIGERAGNAAMEEIVMTLKTRADFFRTRLGEALETGINTRKIVPTSQLVAQLTGMYVQPNKAIVGANAFAHESGIHQHGVIAHRLTYEIMNREDVGWSGSAIVLGKHSGRHAVDYKLRSRGWKLSKKALSRIFERFRAEIKDVLRRIPDEYLEGIIYDEFLSEAYPYRVISAQVSSLYGTSLNPISQVEVEDRRVGRRVAVAVGVGSVDAAFKAVAQALGYRFGNEGDGERLKLVDFHIDALGKGTEAEGVCGVILEDEAGRRTAGLGRDGDIVAAGIKALINALNRLEASREKESELRVTLAKEAEGEPSEPGVQPMCR
ncbi:2-isopropylmalate synthase [Thermosulfurimonas dismutans]|uniref:2-isopropylmalate synthase n=1 Tax=Thermosulfurimonas dismutans TaxID=999894 RepID=A0A179D7E1_9BACT|nr:2-isopropylmalate synthase [Thermosulfurimonas dismutans]OAQ21701.1 2-isopropylmalate synthase [Thermosulfurimonas dismutans]